MIYLILYLIILTMALYWIKRSRHNQELDLEEYRYGNPLVGKYQKIEVDETQDTEVVPLEEALLVNDTSVRHELMLTILHKNPADYLSLLQKASKSDDTEVTHYATTAMMEILTEYEKNMQLFEKRYQTDHGPELLKEYILFCNEFVNAKLLPGNIEQMYRQKLARLISEYFSSQPKKGRTIFICIENDMALGRYEHAWKMLELAKVEYPKDERVYILSTQYYDQMHRYDKIQELVRMAEVQDMILSPRGKEWLAFWSEKQI